MQVRANLGFGLLDAMSEAENVVIVDAMSLGRPPGTCVLSNLDEMANSGPAAPCCHLFGIADVLEVARRLSESGKCAKVLVVGVEGQRFDECGTQLSDAVRAALPVAVGRVLDIVEAGGELRSLARERCEEWMGRDPTTAEVCEGPVGAMRGRSGAE